MFLLVLKFWKIWRLFYHLVIFVNNLPARSVAFICLEVSIDPNVLNGGLLSKLNVHQVRQLSVWLPVGVGAIIPKLIDTKACNSIFKTRGLASAASWNYSTLPALQEDKDHTAWSPTSRMEPSFSSFLGSKSSRRFAVLDDTAIWVAELDFSIFSDSDERFIMFRRT